jgi:predicted membrane-bound dolichyl-phosphate-mannose-protein mannosyltransferase
MEVAKRWLGRLVRWEYSWLVLLLLLVLFSHFSFINTPEKPVFDEKYYVEDAQAILDDEGQVRREHPPLGQLLVTFGMVLFGDEPFGWRFFPVIMGTAGVLFFYLICRNLNLPKSMSYAATFLFATENQSYTQASIAMLDVFFVVFMLAAFWLYLRGSYPLAGVAICLATLAKLNGALTMPVILLHWLVVRRDRRLYFGASMVLAPLLFFELLPLCDFFITGSLVEPVGRIKEMLLATKSVTFDYVVHPYESPPWDWLWQVQRVIIPYWYTPPYTGAISFTIWALIIPTALFMAYQAKKGNRAGLFGSFWFLSTYLFWIPITLLTDRVTFVYYFYPTVGAICLGLGLAFWKLLEVTKNRATAKWVARTAIAVFLAAHVATFVYLSPVFGEWVHLFDYMTFE